MINGRKETKQLALCVN